MSVAQLPPVDCAARRDPGMAGGRRRSVLAGAITLLLSAQFCLGATDAPFLREGRAGFVVSHIEYGLTTAEAEAGACPSGLSLNIEEIFALTPQGKRLPQESDAAYAERLKVGGRAYSLAPNGQNLCMNPEAGGPDPHFRTVQAGPLKAFGIDLDGGPGPGTCAHDEFTGMNGESGIDNQFYRVFGCSRSYRSGGVSNSYAIEMLTGAWGILLTLSGVDDIHNDDSVDVGFFANADPIQLSPGRDPLPYATYLPDPDPGFQSTAHGRIEDGVLTTEPTDVRFHNVTNSMYTVRALRDARLRLTLSENGTMEGYMSGYTPVEALYDTSIGFRNGLTGKGELAPLALRAGTANGAAYVLGYTCNGVYHGLYQYADGHPDPETGKCTSISTQYRIQAIPAFVVDGRQEQSGQGEDRHDP